MAGVLMLGLFSVSWSAAVVACLLGTIPGRSLSFRVALAAIVVSLGVAIPFAIFSFWVSPIFGEEKLPEGVTPGEWGMVGLYAPHVAQWLGHLLLVAAAYVMRQRLLPQTEPDTRTLKLLVMAAALAIFLVMAVPLSLDWFLFKMVKIYFDLLI